jgi:hypothetical protein
MTDLLIEVDGLVDIVFLDKGKHPAGKAKTFSFIAVPFTILVFANPSRWKQFQDSRQQNCESQDPAASFYLSMHCDEQLLEPAVQLAKAGQQAHQ